MSIERNTHLIDWLNDGWTHCQHGTRGWCENYLHNARDVIKAQDDELSRLREALKPFAKVGRSIRGRSVEYTIRGDGYDLDAPLVDANDFVAAARALSEREGQAE